VKFLAARLRGFRFSFRSLAPITLPRGPRPLPHVASLQPHIINQTENKKMTPYNKRTKESIVQGYEQEAQRLQGLIHKTLRLGHLFLTGEIVLFLLAIGMIGGYALVSVSTLWLYGAVACAVIYIIVRLKDSRNDERRKQLENQRKAFLHEIHYQQGNYNDFDDGQRYADSAHPYSTDLDLFGPQSFFHRINRTVTSGGSDLLALWLSHVPASASDIAKRREAVEALAETNGIREKFAACRETTTDSSNTEQIVNTTEGYTTNNVTDTEATLRAVSAIRQFRPASLATRSWVWAFGLIALIDFYVLIILCMAGHVPVAAPLIFGLILFVCVMRLSAPVLQPLTKQIDRLQKQFAVYEQLFRLAGSEPMHYAASSSALLQEIFSRCDDMEEATVRLTSISSTLDSRGNGFFLFLADTFALNGLLTVRRFLHWKKHYENALADGIEAISTLDALVSMATYRYNEPRTIWPEIIEDRVDRIVFDGQNLRHPFLGDKAVGNDFHVDDGHFYIVTGANMAGKSTFLRTIGLSYVMAASGLPVMADRLQVSLFSLFTSMRTTDDLTRGISYFNAELLRLQQLINFVSQQRRPTLLILDEILKGTNSEDKLNGSRMFLEHMTGKPVSGIIATHDLALSTMEDKYPDTFSNFCFEIKLGTDITYTYKITRGVARNQNATYLLKKLLAATPSTTPNSPGKAHLHQ
jgi:hypothetical protein